MIHAREDYQRIQDPYNKIPENEPVFLLRGQDRTAPATLRLWADLNEALGGDVNLINKARNQAVSMELWQRENGKKLSDL